MALTREFKASVMERAKDDAEFRRGLLHEAISALLDAELETGKLLLRDYINATLGFEALSHALNKDPKSLMRMLGPSGNPRADNLLSIIAHLKEREEMTVHLSVGGGGVTSAP